MNNETFGAKLTLLTSEFKNKLKEASEELRQFGKKAEEETTIIPKFEIGDYSKEIEKVQDEMDALRDAIQETKLGKTDFNLEDLKKQYEQLSFKLIGLKNAQKDYNDELDDTEQKASKSTLGKLFDQSIGKIKRFTYYLLGARSVFSLFMRYQSIYYQYNEKLRYQTELSQNAIALSLAPAYEFFGNMVAYASIALAKFIELLTGVNVLSKVSTKGIRDYNKSLKETQTLVSGLDEITNLTLPSGTGLTSQYQALDEFQKKVKEVEEFFKNNKWIQYLADGLKLVWQFLTEKVAPAIENTFRYIVDHWDKLKYLFGAVAITGLMFKWSFKLSGLVATLGTAGTLGKLGTIGTGLTGLAGLVSYLSTIGTIAIGLTIASAFADAKTEELMNYIMGKQTESAESEDNKKVKTLYKEIEEMIKKLSTLSSDSKEYKDLAEQIKQKWDEANKKMEDNAYILNENIDKAKELKSKYEDVFDNTYSTTIELTLPKREMSAWDKFKRGFYSSLADVTSFIPSVSKYFRLKSLTTSTGLEGYAKGLDYVPYDEYPAILHKGEAVVPAKYNPTIHSQGNEYTNSLLETLVMKVDDLANRPNVFEVDGQQFASATYGLYRNEETRQNYNTKVRVNNG